MQNKSVSKKRCFFYILVSNLKTQQFLDDDKHVIKTNIFFETQFKKIQIEKHIEFVGRPSVINA